MRRRAAFHATNMRIGLCPGKRRPLTRSVVGWYVSIFLLGGSRSHLNEGRTAAPSEAPSEPQPRPSADAFRIALPNFEGPLDLLLHLIKEHELDIFDIPIALITEKYIEHLERMREVNLEIAGEFLVMAAALAHIKSRMLLPSPAAQGEAE